MSGVDCGGIDGGMLDGLCHFVSLYKNHRLAAKTHMHRKPNTYTYTSFSSVTKNTIIRTFNRIFNNLITLHFGAALQVYKCLSSKHLAISKLFNKTVQTGQQFLMINRPVKPLFFNRINHSN